MARWQGALASSWELSKIIPKVRKLPFYCQDVTSLLFQTEAVLEAGGAGAGG